MFRNFIIIIFIFLLNGCDYKPIYSNSNNYDFQIVVINTKGDKKINNLIKTKLKKFSKEGNEKLFNIKYNSDYNKSIISKDVTGKALDYQLSLDVNFTINYNGEDQDFTLNQKRNIKNYSDSFEQKNYENTIKESFASVITEQLILKLTNIK